MNISIREQLEPLGVVGSRLSVRYALERRRINADGRLRATLEWLISSRPLRDGHWDYTEADRRQVNESTRRTVDEYQRIRSGSWHSYLHRTVQTVSSNRPTSLAGLQELVASATLNRHRIRAVASGHSFSDVTATSGFAVDTSGLSGELPLDLRWLRTSPVGMGGIVLAEPSRQLIQIGAGTTLRELNLILHVRGSALLNMGGYDGQTFMGAASTSTHGTGISLSPFPDMILSLVLVSEGGHAHRIEPSNGITAPSTYPLSEPTLIQDDDTFNSVIVALGCMGIVYSIVVQVREAYILRERRDVRAWREVANELRSDNFRPRPLIENRHFSVLINPYISRDTAFAHRNERVCTVTTLNEAEPIFGANAEDRPSDSDTEVFIARQLRFLSPEGVAQAMNVMLDLLAVSGPVPYEAQSYDAFIAGGVGIGGYACEWSFPLDRYHAALQVIFDVVDTAANRHEQVMTGPVAIRFVKSSRAYLSPQYGRDTCMIELLSLFGTPGWPDDYNLMHRFYDALIAIGGRPHWGLEFNDFRASHVSMLELYPKWHEWLSVYHRFHQSGIFNNSLTNRLGISIL